MDGETESFIINLLLTLRREHGIIIISHKDALSTIVDKLLLLKSGKIFVAEKKYTANNAELS
jgi:ABC-type transport system involved in cytochrome bd biosynthesis fused ATPase/permease subunit